MPTVAQVKKFVRAVREEHDERIRASLGGGVSGGGSSGGVAVLSTVPSIVDGGFWWEPEGGSPVLKLRKGNYVYSFSPDALTYDGDNSNLVAYLPLTTLKTNDAFGNEWLEYGSPIIKDGALSLDASSYLYNTTISDSIGAQPWTIDFWGSATGGTAFFGTFNTLYPNANYQWVGVKWNNGKFAMHLYGDDPAGTVTVNSGTRAHIAMTYDGTTLRLFVDGVLSLERAHQITLGGDFVIGSTANKAEPIKGTIDHFRIFKGVALWTSDFTPPTAEDYA